jgi:hypothetical protein
VDQCTLVRLGGGVCLNREDGSGMDLTVELPVFGQEDDRLNHNSTVADLGLWTAIRLTMYG